jgi:hypothetical protein
MSTKKEYSEETDPLFKPISEEKKNKIDKQVEKKVRSLTLNENVDKDTEKMNGQNYALISIVSPGGNQKAENVCIKIKGVFNTLDEANKHASILQGLNDTFDIFVVEMYSWLLVPPDPTLIEQKFLDSKLNEIIGGHRESQLKAKGYFEERKRELMEHVEEVDKEETDIVDITDDKELPSGISAGGGVNITSNTPDGNDCPNSTVSTSPGELMNDMVNEKIVESPSKSWGDEQ